MRYSSLALGQGACLRVMSRTITMQGFTLAADAGKTRNFDFDVNADGRTDGRKFGLLYRSQL